MGSAVLGTARLAPGTHSGQSSLASNPQRRVPGRSRAQIQGFEESRIIKQQQELAVQAGQSPASALLRSPIPHVLQPEFPAIQDRMAAHREQCRPFPLFLTLHTLSPPSHVPPLSPGSRPALGLCCSVVGREAPRGSRLDVCAGCAGTTFQCCLCFPRTCLSAQVLVKSPWKKSIGHQPQRMLLVPPTR